MSTTTTIRYDRASDWESWHETLMSKARVHDLYDILTGREELPSRPIRPIATAYLATTSHGPPTRSTAAEASVPILVDGMTYPQAWNVFQNEDTKYDRFRRSYRELTNWIMDSVSDTYRAKWCHSEDELPAWYQNLRDGAVLTQEARRQEAANNYTAAVKPLKVLPRNFEQWISRWETAMIQGIRHQLTDATDDTKWVRDLTQALLTVKPAFVETFAFRAEDARQAGNLNYQFAVGQLRKSWSLQATPHASAKLTHGSFAANHPVENSDDELEAPTASSPAASRPRSMRNRPSKAPRQQNNKRARSNSMAIDQGPRKQLRIGYHPIERSGDQRSGDQSSGPRCCRLCEGPHDLAGCFYVVAPTQSAWRPNPLLAKVLHEKMEHDRALREDVERIRREKRNPA